MARVACHVLLAVGEFRVDFPGHLDHAPRNHFVWILVAGKIGPRSGALHVASQAIAAERGRILLHQAAVQFSFREHLKVFCRWWPFLGLVRGLSEKNAGENGERG